jgi:hypothetical protein
MTLRGRGGGGGIAARSRPTMKPDRGPNARGLTPAPPLPRTQGKKRSQTRSRPRAAAKPMGTDRLMNVLLLACAVPQSLLAANACPTGSAVSSRLTPAAQVQRSLQRVDACPSGSAIPSEAGACPSGSAIPSGLAFALQVQRSLPGLTPCPSASAISSGLTLLFSFSDLFGLSWRFRLGGSWVCAGATCRGAGKPGWTVSFVITCTTRLSPREQYHPNSIFQVITCTGRRGLSREHLCQKIGCCYRPYLVGTTPNDCFGT